MRQPLLHYAHVPAIFLISKRTLLLVALARHKGHDERLEKLRTP